MATRPRKIDPKTVFYVTVRCINRSYRLVPKPRICESLKYCLAIVLEEYRAAGKLRLFEFEFMSNHYHMLGEDITGCLPDFVRDLNSLASRQINAIRGTSDSNFSHRPFGLVQVHGGQRIVDHAVYTLANPVAAFLVAKARHWKGCSSLWLEYGQGHLVAKPRGGLWGGGAKHAHRPESRRSGRATYANRSVLPEQATLVIDRPPVLMHLSDDELRAHIRQLLARREDEIAAQRASKGINVLGRRAAESVHHMATPRPEELFARNPQFSAENVRDRRRLAKVYKAFARAYYAARDVWYRLRLTESRAHVEFPEGTYWLRKHFGVTCVDLCVT